MFSWIKGTVSRLIWGTPKTEDIKQPTNQEEQPEVAKSEEPKKIDNDKKEESKPIATPQQPKQASKPAFDRSIFVQRNKTDEVIKRVPGQINGNQFVASDLVRCKVIVQDFVDSMIFDRCTDCEFILSAVRGSIFARTCTNCKFVMITGQFRCRDCNNCDFFMHVKTGPVVESSHSIRIGCAEMNYPEMYEHMKKAQIPILNNLWIDVYNFTPQDGDFSYNSGAKLHLELQENEESLVPFTYQKDSSKTYFSFQCAQDKQDELIKLSHQDAIHIHKITEESDSFTVVVEGKDENEVQTAFSAASISNIKKLE